MRSSVFRTVVVATALVAVGGCAQQQQRNVAYANVNLSFSADPARVESIVADVQKRFLALGDAGKHASVNVNSGNNSGMSPAASTVPVESMSLALDDARRKAGEIAQHDGVKLGSIRTVSEDLAYPPTFANAPLERVPAPIGVNARVSSVTGTTILRVEFADDRDGAIVVYGIAANANAHRYPQRATGATFNVNATGATSTAGGREVVEAYIAAFNAAMHAANLPPTDYAVSNMNYST
jgi:hypothetical protein